MGMKKKTKEELNIEISAVKTKLSTIVADNNIQEDDFKDTNLKIKEEIKKYEDGIKKAYY